ncbi:sulfurtransferase [Candidatus Aerophobetes bacterium Ae_b3a]|nr:MAG: sulfurtransferase [Candidatus Aerophobetes bacterium Ae_b3a]
MKICSKKLETLVLSGILVIGVALLGGCAERITAIQVIKDISVKEVYDLIGKNKDNQGFIIIDVRTPEEFANEHIENALNLDYYSEKFRDELNKLDKEKTYLIYCGSGNRSGKALSIMKELAFREVYNMLGGVIQWKAEGYPL